MTALREDRCPGVLRLHRAEDGGLARIRLPGGRIGVEQLEAVARAARLGNGIVELTSRANLQLRGLSDETAAPVERLLADAGLLPSRTHELVRNVVASPLAGRHPRSIAPTDAVVEALDAALLGDASLASLPGRFLFAVDDGTGLAGEADVSLIATDGGFALGLGGRPTNLVADAPRAVALAVGAAAAFLELRLDEWRVAELEDGPRRLASSLGARIERDRPVAAVRLAPGPLEQRDGRFAVIALPPLGRLGPAALDGLATLAAGGPRLSRRRTLTLLDVERDEVEAATASLARLGLVVAPRSGWEGLSACAGLGACSKALVDVRAEAARRASERGPDDPSEHWSGCERRCGEPRDVGLAVFPGAAR